MSIEDAAEPIAWDPEVGHPARWSILAICCLCLVVIVIAVSSLNVAIPSIVDQLGPSPTQLLWIIDSYAIVFAGLLLPAGALGDRFGRRGALLVGLAVFGVGALAASGTDSPGELIAMRSVMGAGAALVMPATLSLVTSVFAPADRPKAIATWAGFAGAGSALGPPLSGLLLANFWWGSVFFINIPVVVVAMALVVTRVPTSRDPHRRRLDLTGALLSIVALGALLLGIIEGPEQGWASLLVLASFVLALAGGVAFVLWELRTPDPMLDPRFFRIPAFRAGAAVVTAIFFGMFGMFFLITQFLQQVKGYSPLVAGLSTLPSALTLILVTPRSPLVVARFGARPTVVGGMSLVTVGYVGMSLLTPTSPYVHVAAALVVVATGMGLSMAPASTAIVSALPQSKAGVASAVNDVTREVGGALGIAVLGSVLTARYRAEMAVSLSDPALPASVPGDVVDAAGSSIGEALSAIATAPGSAAAPVLELARISWTHAMSAAFLVSALVVGLMAVIARFSMPGRLPVRGGVGPARAPAEDDTAA